MTHQDIAKRSLRTTVLCDEVETVKGFRYLGNRLNASGVRETAVTLRVRIEWMKFRKCGELLRGKLKILRALKQEFVPNF